MQQIVDVHFPGKQHMVKEAMEIFDAQSSRLEEEALNIGTHRLAETLMADDIPDEILTNRDASKAIHRHMAHW